MTRDRIRAWGHELRLTHDRLIDDIALIRTALERGDPTPELERDLRTFCAGFCGVLTRHHTAEDAELFPRIAQQHPDLARIISKLQQDHDMIATLIVGLERALREKSRGELLAHVEGLEAIMTSHFRFEERQLLEVLDGMSMGEAAVERLLGLRVD